MLTSAGVLSAQGKQLFGRVSFPLGTVQVLVTPNPGWAKVNLNHELFVGDRLRTLQKSRCEITLNGGGKLRISENSELVLTQAVVSPLKKEFGATASRGQVWVAAKAAFGETKNVAIRAPTAVAAIRGTKYRIVADTAESSVLVYEGSVDVIWAEAAQDGQDGDDGQDGAPGPFRIGPPQEVAPPEEVPGPYEVSLEDWITLVEGTQINVRADGFYNLFEFDQAADAELEFVRWNKDLDTQQGE
ncbi:MAG: FecR family protein [Candidatus Neomarinimicrobiota bacterium]